MRTVLPVLIAMSLVAAPTAVDWPSGDRGAVERFTDIDSFGLNPNSSYDVANEHFRVYFDALDVEFVVRILDAIGRR